VILNIRVIPKASRNLIMPNAVTREDLLRHPEATPRRNITFGKKENDSLKAYLTKPAQDGLANKQLIELLATHLRVKKYQIKIIKGEKSRNKVVAIDTAAGTDKK